MKDTPQLSPGDVVLIKIEEKKRIHWHSMGIILEIYHGRDNSIRTALMVRYHVKSTTERLWTSVQLQAAITDIHEGRRSMMDVARSFGIRQSNIQKRMKTNNTSPALM
ncbi:hypothetical protein ILUMI_18049 [Ignelater luminosus]|uniref:DUF5641 domain-containing protein n=1 Tax=Ignelater luminosus TaxID=2038154 RepID=A0A8K0CKM2_IGNLU|nr:hypothetical protein ILUMI_18049 [Ignelater luminosus]